MRPPTVPADLEQLALMAAALQRAGRRAMLGITGPPGAGKSSLAHALVGRLETHRPGSAVLVGMDGFHLAQSVLKRLELVDVKGAPQTFDGDGYVAMLSRLRQEPARTIWCPEFRREIEDAVAGAVEVRPQVRLVVSEGNYLLLDQPPWDEVRPLLDACWYVDLDDGVRRDRLIHRHERHGRSAGEATARATGSDEANAGLVSATRRRADLVVANT